MPVALSSRYSGETRAFRVEGRAAIDGGAVAAAFAGGLIRRGMTKARE